MRYDASSGDWVAVAAHRQDRTFLPPPDACPLCPSGPVGPTEIPDRDYDVVVFENRFPSLLAGRGRPDPASGGRRTSAPEPARPLRGRVLHQRPRRPFADLRERVRTVIEAWADRTAELCARPEVEQVFCFENRGQEIGVTLTHPHGQIYAYPYLPPHPGSC